MGSVAAEGDWPVRCIRIDLTGGSVRIPEARAIAAKTEADRIRDARSKRRRKRLTIGGGSGAGNFQAMG